MTEFSETSYKDSGAGISLLTPEGETAGSVVITKTGNRVKIGYLDVKPAFRGHQYGEALLLKAEDWARNHGITEIYGHLDPVPGSEKALLEALTNRGYEINRKTGVVRKHLVSED